MTDFDRKRTFGERLTDGLASGCLLVMIDVLSLAVASAFVGAYFGLVYCLAALVFGGIAMAIHFSLREPASSRDRHDGE
jgi:hypothetical protein